MDPVRPLIFSVAALLALGACSAGERPAFSAPPLATVMTPTASLREPSTAASTALEGEWTSGVTPIGEIRAAMVDAGISAEDADAWVAEVGSPLTYRFELLFRDGSFEHRQQVDGGPVEVDEAGRFELEADRLTLSVGDETAVDVYTFAITVSSGRMRLRWLSSSDSGSPEDREHHRRYTIAFFCSTTFVRE